MSEPENDSRSYWVFFYRDTVEFLRDAVAYYEGLLATEATEVDADPHLKAFLTEEVRREMRFGRGHREAVRTREWLEQALEKSKDQLDCDLSVDHGTVRYFKSVGLLYLGFLKQRRNLLASKPNITLHLLSALDRQITRREEELTSQGVFGNASVLPLLVEQEFASPAAAPSEAPNTEATGSVAHARRPSPVLVDSIEILDPELRRRCLDLFRQFEASAQADRHDTVVTEATRILEDRLRKLTGTTDGATGAELATRAFAGNAPALRVSDIEAEQQAAHLLYRGVFGFIRNNVHHKLRPDLASERVLQILGLIDYLIFLANTGASGAGVNPSAVEA